LGKFRSCDVRYKKTFTSGFLLIFEDFLHEQLGPVHSVKYQRKIRPALEQRRIALVSDTQESPEKLRALEEVFRIEASECLNMTVFLLSLEIYRQKKVEYDVSERMIALYLL
jgi:hypothetical protein